MPNILKKFLFFFLLCLNLPSKSEELSENFVPLRANGMGGAFTAIADDASSIWTNPAGISRIRKARSQHLFHLLTLPNLTFGANREGQSFYEKLQAAQGATISGAKENVQAALQSVSELASTPLWIQASLNPLAFFSSSKYSPPWVFGLLTNIRTSITIDNGGDSNPDNDTASVESVSDAGMILGSSWSNRTNRLNVGMNIRPLMRNSYYDKISLSTLTNKHSLSQQLKNESNNGQGIGVDVGFLWTFADFWFPSFALAAFNLPTGCKSDYLNPFAQERMNICGTKITGTIKNAEDPALIIPTDLRFGFSITPRLTHTVGLRFAVDMHHLYLADSTHVYGLSGVQALRQTHAGVELFVGNPLALTPLSVRIGYGQGFMSTGLTVRMGAIALEFATFGEDISTSDSPQEDRRLLSSLTAEF